MSNIFFDLDGTLLDSQQRLYLLFQHLVPASNLSFEDYWDLKKNRVDHGQILRRYFLYSDEHVSAFTGKWMELIETNEWLQHDKPFDGVDSFLKELKKEHHVFLATSRQSTTMLQAQLARFGWNEIFEKIFVTEQKKEKTQLIREGAKLEMQDWLVGDTGKDIQTGKELGIQTAAVLSGFLNRERLAEYEPDIILNNVTELKPA